MSRLAHELRWPWKTVHQPLKNGTLMRNMKESCEPREMNRTCGIALLWSVPLRFSFWDGVRRASHRDRRHREAILTQRDPTNSNILSQQWFHLLLALLSQLHYATHHAQLRFSYSAVSFFAEYHSNMNFRSERYTVISASVQWAEEEWYAFKTNWNYLYLYLNVGLYLIQNNNCWWWYFISKHFKIEKTWEISLQWYLFSI